MRVDVENAEDGDKKKHDYDSTIFIGNLPWVSSEEDLRAHFSDIGEILNVRIIRDPKTHLGKGFGYVQFSSKEDMRKAIDNKNKAKFHVTSFYHITFLGKRT